MTATEPKAQDMADIRFECPNCSQHLTATEELANQLIECPGCKQTIEVPILRRPTPESSPAAQALPSPTASGRRRRLPPGTVALPAVFSLYLLILVLILRQWREDETAYGLANLGAMDKPTDYGPVLLWLVTWGIVTSCVGFLAGKSRGKQRLGAAWGLALGPIGWLITLCTADLRPRCLECRGVIAEGARRCMHCGAAQVASPDNAPGGERLERPQTK